MTNPDYLTHHFALCAFGLFWAVAAIVAAGVCLRYGLRLRPEPAIPGGFDREAFLVPAALLFLFGLPLFIHQSRELLKGFTAPEQAIVETREVVRRIVDRNP